MLTSHREREFKVHPVTWVANRVEDENGLGDYGNKLQKTTGNGREDRAFSLVSKAIKGALNLGCVGHLDDGSAVTNSVLFK